MDDKIVIVDVIRIHEIRYTKVEIRNFTWDELQQILSFLHHPDHHFHPDVVKWVKEEVATRKKEKAEGKNGRFWDPRPDDPPSTPFPTPRHYPMQSHVGQDVPPPSPGAGALSKLTLADIKLRSSREKPEASKRKSGELLDAVQNPSPAQKPRTSNSKDNGSIKSPAPQRSPLICPGHKIPSDRYCAKCTLSYCKICWDLHLKRGCVAPNVLEKAANINVATSSTSYPSLCEIPGHSGEANCPACNIKCCRNCLRKCFNGCKQLICKNCHHKHMEKRCVDLNGISYSAAKPSAPKSSDEAEQKDKDVTPEREVLEYELQALNSKGESLAYHGFNFLDGKVILGKVAGKGRREVGYSSISDTHCEITMDEKSFKIKDLNSSNGTWVNGNKLVGDGRTVVSLGDVIQLASWSFKFVKKVQRGEKKTSPMVKKADLFEFEYIDDDDDDTPEETREERRRQFREYLERFELGNMCPETKKLIAELEKSGIYLYQLCYVDENGKTCTAWDGVTNNPNRRWHAHQRNEDENEGKRAIFEKYSDTIFMRILFKGTMAQCLMLEHLLIHNSEKLGDVIVNKDKKNANIEFQSDVMVALRELVENAEKINICRTNTTAFGENLEKFVVDEVACSELMKLLEEFVEPNCYIYCLKYITRDGKSVIKFYIGVSHEPEQRLTTHRSKTSNEDKWNIIRDNKSRVFMKIFLKSDRAVAEIVELLMIQDEDEPNLTNKQKKSAKKPELEADLDLVIAEMKALEESTDILLFMKDAKEAAKYRGARNIKNEKFHLRDKIIRRSTKLEQSKTDVALDFPEPVSTEDGRSNLQSMLRFESTGTYTFHGHTETAYSHSRYSIIPDGEVFAAADLVGSFRSFTREMLNDNFVYQNYTQKQFITFSSEEKDEIQKKKHQLLVFFARVGILFNKLLCTTQGCTKAMVLVQDKKTSPGYLWRCYQSRNDCANTNANKNVFLFPKDTTVPFNIPLQILYLFSKGHTQENISEALGTNAYAAFIGPGDGSLTELIDDAIVGSQYETKESFFADQTLDHLGLIIYWIRMRYSNA